MGAIMPNCINTLIKSMGLRTIRSARSRTVTCVPTVTVDGGRVEPFFCLFSYGCSCFCGCCHIRAPRFSHIEYLIFTEAAIQTTAATQSQCKHNTQIGRHEIIVPSAGSVGARGNRDQQNLADRNQSPHLPGANGRRIWDQVQYVEQTREGHRCSVGGTR